MSRPGVLTIAGSDSGGGAGVQADLRTISTFGVHASTVVVALTAQNSRSVVQVHALPDDIIEAQIDAVMSDLSPEVVKLGMLANARIVRLVARKLTEWRPRAIVLDPVMLASSGDALLEEEAVDEIRDLLLPLSTVVTPNWPEAGALINAHPRGLQDVQRIAISFQRLGAARVLIKGGHLPGDSVVDTLWDGDEVTEFTHPRIAGAEGHGTGCTLASALAAGLALERSLQDSARDAVAFVHRALLARYGTGGSRDIYLDIEGRG